jgi:hypothetical protein
VILHGIFTALFTAIEYEVVVDGFVCFLEYSVFEVHMGQYGTLRA